VHTPLRPHSLPLALRRTGKAKKAGKLIKFGGGFYCAFLEEHNLYTFNAFFMEMRGKFTAPSANIHWFLVEFNPAELKWEDFRGKVLGPTDPKDAPADSLRGMIGADWNKLGLAAECTTGDNAVHASASPFEGLAEQMNWLQMPIAENSFGKALLDAGLSEAMIKEWSVDPQVVIGDGKKGSIFDQLEDKDFADCLELCTKLSKMQ
jgi:nucleoside diphosphate kinase